MKQGVSWWLIFRWECCKNSKSFVSIYADVIFLVIPRQSPQRHMNYQFSTKCWKQNPCIKNHSVSNILSFDFSILQKTTSCLPLFFPPETFNGFDGAYRFNVKGLRNLLSLHRVAAQIQVISRGDSRILSPNSVLYSTDSYTYVCCSAMEMTIKPSCGEYVVFFPTTELANPSIYFTFKFPNIYTT